MSPATLRNYHIPNKALLVRGLMARVIITAAGQLYSTGKRDLLGRDAIARDARQRHQHAATTISNTEHEPRQHKLRAAEFRGFLRIVCRFVTLQRAPETDLYRVDGLCDECRCNSHSLDSLHNWCNAEGCVTLRRNSLATALLSFCFLSLLNSRKVFTFYAAIVCKSLGVSPQNNPHQRFKSSHWH